MSRTASACVIALLLVWCGAVRGMDQLGTADDARAMLDRAVAALKANEKAALKSFNDEDNKKFRDRDLFVYCFSLTDGKFTAYQSPMLLGADVREFKLYDEPMGQRAFDVAHDASEGQVVSIEYKLPKPGTKTPAPKEALEARVGSQACGVSYFK
jgi:hypothetical protein